MNKALQAFLTYLAISGCLLTLLGSPGTASAEVLDVPSPAASPSVLLIVSLTVAAVLAIIIITSITIW